MTEMARIRDQLRRMVTGDAWHGPSVEEAMAAIAPATAAYRLSPETHSPAELVLHMAAWLEIVARRLRGERVEPTEAEDWPSPGGEDDAAWRACVERLRAAYAALDAQLAAADDARLAEKVPGRSMTMYVMLHGVVQHCAWHAGQVMLLARSAGR